MTAIERTAYPRFRTVYTEQELQEFYLLDDAELALVTQNTKTKAQQLLLAMGVKCFQTLGYLPRLNDVPNTIVLHIAKQLDLSPQQPVSNLPSRTRKRYRQLIRDYLRIRPYRDG